MFNLDLPTAPYWIDLPRGVRVLVKPLDGVIVTAARNLAVRTINEMSEARAEAAAAHAPTLPGMDLDDPNVRDAMVRWEFVRGLARYGMIGWDGVGDPSGTAALDFTPARGQALAVHPLMIDTFLDRYLEPQTRVVAEGNGSAASPDGPSAEAASTATDAATSDVPPALPN